MDETTLRYVFQNQNIETIRPIPRSRFCISNIEYLECSSFEKIINKQYIEKTSNNLEEMINSGIANDVELYNNLESVINSNSFSNKVEKCI